MDFDLCGTSGNFAGRAQPGLWTEGHGGAETAFPGLIVLEVEKPETDLSIRRIGFYRRCGFSLCEKEYIQPAYRKGGEELPLFLMYTGTDTLDPQFETVRDNIHRKVYGVVR